MARSVRRRSALAGWVSQARTRVPGAVRASAGIDATPADIDRFLGAVADVTAGPSGSRTNRTRKPATSGPSPTTRHGRTLPAGWERRVRGADGPLLDTPGGIDTMAGMELPEETIADVTRRLRRIEGQV